MPIIQLDKEIVLYNMLFVIVKKYFPIIFASN